MSVAGVVLAAGRGSRMGRPKALVEFEGESFLGRVVKSMRRGGVGPITVVVAQGMEDVAEESRAAGADVGVNPHPERGQLSSFEVGVGGLGSGCLGAVVALVDHPLVRSSTYRAVVTTYERAFSPTDHVASSANMLWLGTWRNGERGYFYKEDERRATILRRKEGTAAN